MSQLKTALVIGASRGLGKGLVHEFASRGVAVTGTVRDAAQIEVLRSDSPGHVTWQILDVNDPHSADHFVRNLAHPRYDVVYINAGVGGPDHDSVEKITKEELVHLFATNAIAPIRLAHRLTPYLQEGGTMAFMTSILGSVQLAEGYKQLYSASKAALNSLSRGYAASVADKGYTVLSMHPGWVKTDMGGEGAPLDVATSVRGIADVVEQNAGKGGHHYLDYEGKNLPW